MYISGILGCSVAFTKWKKKIVCVICLAVKRLVVKIHNKLQKIRIIVSTMVNTFTKQLGGNFIIYEYK